MTDFRAPGMAASRRTFAVRGLIGVVVIGAVLVLTAVIVAVLPTDEITVRMHADSVAGGINPGSTVVLNGAEIGTVQSITAQGPEQFTLALAVDKQYADRPDVFTDAMTVTYAPKNLFGIAAVVLTTGEGGKPLRAGSDFYPDSPVDSTLTVLLRNLSDLQSEAFAPYMSDILASAGNAVDGLVPVLGTVGEIAARLASTAPLPPSSTLPQLAATVATLPDVVRGALPGVDALLAWTGPDKPGYVDRQDTATAYLSEATLPQLGRVLGEQELGALMPLVPTLTEILDRVRATFPDARRNGLEIAQLIAQVRRALPNGPDGRPVLNVDVVLAGVPGVSAALGVGGPQRGAR